MNSLDDRETWAIESLGQLLLVQERYEDAAVLLSGLRALRPERPFAWYGLALLHERGGDVESARTLYERASRASDRAPDYLLREAEALIRMGDVDAAADLLREVTAGPNKSLAHRATALLRIHLP